MYLQTPKAHTSLPNLILRLVYAQRKQAGDTPSCTFISPDFCGRLPRQMGTSNRVNGNGENESLRQILTLTFSKIRGIDFSVSFTLAQS